jgi:hypothetical protein
MGRLHSFKKLFGGERMPKQLGGPRPNWKGDYAKVDAIPKPDIGPPMYRGHIGNIPPFQEGKSFVPVDPRGDDSIGDDSIGLAESNPIILNDEVKNIVANASVGHVIGIVYELRNVIGDTLVNPVKIGQSLTHPSGVNGKFETFYPHGLSYRVEPATHAMPESYTYTVKLVDVGGLSNAKFKVTCDALPDFYDIEDLITNSNATGSTSTVNYMVVKKVIFNPVNTDISDKINELFGNALALPMYSDRSIATRTIAILDALASLPIAKQPGVMVTFQCFYIKRKITEQRFYFSNAIYKTIPSIRSIMSRRTDTLYIKLPSNMADQNVKEVSHLDLRKELFTNLYINDGTDRNYGNANITVGNILELLNGDTNDYMFNTAQDVLDYFNDASVGGIKHKKYKTRRKRRSRHYTMSNRRKMNKN